MKNALLKLLKEKLNIPEEDKFIKIYPQILINAKVKDAKKYDFDNNKEIVSEIKKLEKKFEGNGRVLIRPSGTEPLVRVMIEGEDQAYISQKANHRSHLQSEV